MRLHLPALLVVDRISREHLKNFFAWIGLRAWAALTILLLFLLGLSLSLSGARNSGKRSLSRAVRLDLPAFLVVYRVSREHLQNLLTGVRLGAWAALAFLLLFLLGFSIDFSLSGTSDGRESSLCRAMRLDLPAFLMVHWVS